jgi:hypothetical protein
MVDYLGSTINVIASRLGLVTVVICLLAGASLWIWPAVLVAYAIGAAGTYLVLRRSGNIAPPGPPDREAAPRRLLTPSRRLGG